jgi:hypothetical protein
MKHSTLLLKFPLELLVFHASFATSLVRLPAGAASADVIRWNTSWMFASNSLSDLHWLYTPGTAQAAHGPRTSFRPASRDQINLCGGYNLVSQMIVSRRFDFFYRLELIFPQLDRLRCSDLTAFQPHG